MKPPDKPIDLETYRKNPPDDPYRTARRLIALSQESATYWRGAAFIAIVAMALSLVTLIIIVTKKPPQIIIYRDYPQSVYDPSNRRIDTILPRTNSRTIAHGAARDR